MKNKQLICSLFLIFAIGNFGVLAHQEDKEKRKPKVPVKEKEDDKQKEREREERNRERESKDNKKPPKFLVGS